MARTIVTMEESASGMAATARATANIRESSMPIPVRNTERANTAAQITIITTASFALNLSRLS